MDKSGSIFWSDEKSEPKSLDTLPKKLQIPFLLKFIHNHELSDKVKFIQNPIVCIELYIKAQFLIFSKKD